MLAQSYFEQFILSENERNIGWLLAEFDPENDIKDQYILEGITGYKE